MSQIKIIVRQPPNRDFLEGFPGIPPNAPERPHAALRGTVELRVQGGTPVKAKWVQIELKKIETVLQGQGEPYVETIGHAPKIWTANGEFENLQVRDFPFYIQIPMNVPPSIALEKGSGIRYEMVASLCMKGKKGLLRMKDKNNITSTSVPIVMDKHELHTLWPVYHRPQTSTATNDGLNLIVTREASCYGPGDSVMAHVELRSGRPGPCILRAWEMTLREHVIFRPDPSQVNTKQAPAASGQQYRHNVIAEQKKSLSKTIYEGVTVADDLACLIPIQHRTATTSGRLIEVQFTLSVKAVMESAGNVEVMMPVLMSHWSKEMSENVLRKIGPVPHLGVNFPPAEPVKPAPQGYSQSQLSDQTPPVEKPQMPKPEPPNPDDIGPPSPPYTPPETGLNFSSQQSVTGRQNGRPRESTVSSRNRTLAVVNVGPTEDGLHATQSPPLAPVAQPYKASWESAEEEKRRLKESYTQNLGQSSGSGPPPSGLTSAPATPLIKPNFSSAEEEKERLYKRAQAQARKTQELARREAGLAARTPASVSRETSATSASASASASDSSGIRPSTATTATSVASSAMPLTPPATASTATPTPTRAENPAPAPAPAPATPNWASAEAEKERLYRQAQRRARETQARVASAGGSVSGRSRSGSNTSLTSMATQRQSTLQGARPNSTFKLNNPDPQVAAPVASSTPLSSPSLAPARETSVSPGPGPSNASGSGAPLTHAQALYAQAMAARQSQSPAPAPASPPRQSAVYSPTPAQPTYGHASRPSQASSAGYSQGSGSGSQGGSNQPPSYGTGPPSAAPARSWSTAEDEKAQLNRYYEAKRAVAEREQGGGIGDSMAGGSSSAQVPSYAASSASSPPHSTYASPQPVPQHLASGSPSPPAQYGAPVPMRVNSIASRQEQTPSPVYTRTYPQQAPTPPVGYQPQSADYFNQSAQRSLPAPQASPSPPAFAPAARSSQAPLPTDEKERMRLFFEAQDAARRFQETQGASGSGSGGAYASSPPPPPMASSSSYASPPPTAGPPGYDDAPPAFDGGSSRPMSALEEKARLAREYQQQQQQQQAAQGQLSRNASLQSVRSPGPSQVPHHSPPLAQSPSYGTNGLPPISTQYGAPSLPRATSYKYMPSPIEEEPPSGPPPPLAPRPPKEYIEKIIQEEEGILPEEETAPSQSRQPPSRQPTWDPQPLNFRPVSPFNIPVPNAQSPPPQQQWQPVQPQPQYAQQQYSHQPQPPNYR